MRNLLLKSPLWGLMLLAAMLMYSSCDKSSENDMRQSEQLEVSNISDTVQKETVSEIQSEAYSAEQVDLLQRGVAQVANLWRESDGDVEAFKSFCKTHYESDPIARRQLFNKLERAFEVLLGHYNKMDLKLKEPLHLRGDALTDVDQMIGGYDVSAHFSDDMYSSKLAFVTALNFPPYTLSEKTTKGESWSREEWAYARMGDMFVARVPAALNLEVSKILTKADSYIAEYNICMDQLRNEAGEQLFPDGMRLISHWGLRDEIKSNYGDPERGLEKQRTVYEVIKHIVKQDIPAEVINNDQVSWNPYSNVLYKDGQVVENAPREEDVRYTILSSLYKTYSKLDPYYPQMPTQLDRTFEGTMEIPQEDVVKLFDELLSSPQLKEVASIISQRLGRPLEPFDIWYNGFSAGESIPESQLDKMTMTKYPNPEAVWKDLPNILVKLGWSREKADEICSLVAVDPARGAGHAWGSSMRGEKAHLRTRIKPEGMDYKGYNIAVHEFGHNVEQTISMNDVDYYILNGVPNTSFTEGAAFLFQNRDLELLGVSKKSDEDVHWEALSMFWNTCEIMGVSLVDIAVWEWMYDHPNATSADLREAVLEIAKEVWNKYFAEVLGGKDEPLLAVYSHMVNYPLYLPNYPFGHLISFQIEEAVRGKNLADEFTRMYTYGKIIPQLWMKHAVGCSISIQPLLHKTSEAIEWVSSK